MWLAWGTENAHTGLWLGDPIGRNSMKNLVAEGRILLKSILNKWDREACTRLFYLRI
jgi:hypothetical protein